MTVANENPINEDSNSEKLKISTPNHRVTKWTIVAVPPDNMYFKN